MHTNEEINQQTRNGAEGPPSRSSHRGSVGRPETEFGWIHELFKQQQTMMQEQQQTFMKQQEKFIAEIWQTARCKDPVNVEQISDVLAGQIKDFRFNPEECVTFTGWFSRYEDLFEKDAHKLEDDGKVRLLLRKLGLPEHERYTSYVLPSKPKDLNFAETVSKLKSLFGPPESEVSKRFKCLQLQKTKLEDYVAFSCRVNKSVVESELAVLTEEQLKCFLFVCGLKDDSDAEVRLRLLKQIRGNGSITLPQLVEECQQIVDLKGDTVMIEGENKDVNVVKDGKLDHIAQKWQNNRVEQGAQRKASIPVIKCWLCGEGHFARKCSYGGYRCKQCHKYGHKEGHCNAAERYRKSKTYGKVRTVVVNRVMSKDKGHVSVMLNGESVKMMVDTSADISIISREQWRKIGEPPLRPPSVKAKTASGNKLRIIGEFSAQLTLKQQTKNCTVRVTEEQLMLLGADMMDVFGLWDVPLASVCNSVCVATQSMESVRREFGSLFSHDLGHCTKAKVRMELKKEAVPVFRPKRPVSYAMRPAIDEELDRLEKEGIINRVNFSAWAAPIVVVRKANGSIRICGDYSTGLNNALQPHQYPIPLPEEIFSTLTNSAMFSQIDLTDAFLQVEVEQECRELLTVNTHRGLYAYNRLPPGVKVAPGAFQQLMETMLAGIKDVAVYLDDIVIGGADEHTHMMNLRAVLAKLREYGFKIRPEKCKFLQKQIKYLGHILDREGQRPDPAKIEAIVNMPTPKNPSEVRSFLGAMNYYGKFVPQMRNLRYPLDDLLKKDGHWQWSPECQQAFETFKRILTSDLLLTYYDPRKPIIVAADASSVGVGATISHKMSNGTMKIIQHASRALTKTEMGYSQPDHEGLAIIYAVTKFHRMIFGRRFTLQTDHAPLLRIFGSRTGIPVYTANRLQRWALTLLMYDFNIEYV
ncbi:uncharacterized protein K02A2.6-like [Anopheles marshallii]|uniref:uncharacterized protein K02A2.6-like n=1 Tax=Anopheles marshallii TaxID=1521116 RepID=UPI00237B4BB6|nr:uncharacterized protein K02A2.6-like [Anopheles marshallii]